MGQRWGLPSANHCDQYADIFADAAQEFLSNVIEKLINSEEVSSKLRQLSRAIERGQESGELEKHEVRVELDYRGGSCTFFFPCSFLLDQFGALLVKYGGIDEVLTWKKEQEKNVMLMVEMLVGASFDFYYSACPSSKCDDSGYDSWVKKSKEEVKCLNSKLGEGFSIDKTVRLDWKASDLLTLIKGMLGIEDHTQEVAQSFFGQLGRIIWEFESQCRFLYNHFMQEKGLPMSLFFSHREGPSRAVG